MSTDTSPTGSALPPTAALPTVGEVMRPATTTVESRAHLAGAAYLMKRSGDTALVVTTNDETMRPRAVLTDADISKAVADGRDLEETRIEQLWSDAMITVEPGTAVDEATRTMLAHRIHHLPVVDAGRLVGIVDMSDLCRALVGAGAVETRPPAG